MDNTERSTKEWKIGNYVFTPCKECGMMYDQIMKQNWKEKKERYGEAVRKNSRKRYLQKMELRSKVIAALVKRPEGLDKEEWGEDGTCFCACGGVSGNYVDRCSKNVLVGTAFLIGADEVGQALLRGRRVGPGKSSGLDRAIEMWGEPWASESNATEWRKHMGVYCGECYTRAARRRSGFSENRGCWHDINRNRRDHPYPLQQLEAYFF